ncbi:MAG: hypothetical protein AAGI69_28950 [Cyanobacteria bacterium P01_H01_bin.21]
MKYKILVLPVLSGLIATTLGSLSAAANPGRCAEVVGKWSWDSCHFSVELRANKTVDGYDGGDLSTGTWTCEDARGGGIKVRWSTGFTDLGWLSNNG